MAVLAGSLSARIRSLCLGSRFPGVPNQLVMSANVRVLLLEWRKFSSRRTIHTIESKGIDEMPR